MFKEVVCTCFVLMIFLSTADQAVPAEKIKFGTPVKEDPGFYLPVLAAEEGGFWNVNGIEVEWFPFQGGGPLYQAIASGRITVGGCVVSSSLQAIAKGKIPIVYVSDLFTPNDFMVWVSPSSRIKEAKDLKGAKIGVARLGGAEHAYGRAVARSLGLEKDVKFVSTGGTTEAVAGLKTGVIDAVVLPSEVMVMLKFAGDAQELVRVSDYIPKEWVDNVIFTTKDYLKNNPDVVRKVVKSLLQGTEFIRKNPRWTIEKLKSVSGYSEKAAQYIYNMEIKRFTRNGKIGAKALENVRDFLIKYEIVPEQEAPALADVYTSQFTD